MCTGVVSSNVKTVLVSVAGAKDSGFEIVAAWWHDCGVGRVWSMVGKGSECVGWEDGS